MTRDQLSVGIVGGGIAGLYCAWRLAGQGHSVTVFESLGRAGGRIETLDLDGFKAECGPMRFELATQQLFRDFAKDELGVTFERFPEPEGHLADFPRYQLAEDERSRQQINEETAARATPDSTSGSSNGSADPPLIQSSHRTSSLDLLRLGVYRMFNPGDRKHLTEVVESSEDSPSLIAKCADELTGNESTLAEIRSERRLKGDGGPLLHKTGFWNALAQVLSPNAVAKIRDVGTFYHLMPENPSASEWAIFWLRAFRSDAALSTIPAGVQSVVHKLEEKLKKQKERNELPGANVDIWTNATVTRVRPGRTRDKVGVTVEHGPQVSRERLEADFDHVILALPQWPLRRLAEFFPPRVREAIDEVIGFPLLKAFLVTNLPWWNEDQSAQHGADKVPTRELHYQSYQRKQATGGPDRRGMIMLYTDRPATAFWQPFVQEPHVQAQEGKTEELKDELVWHLLVALRRDAAEMIAEKTRKLLPEPGLFKELIDRHLKESLEESFSDPTTRSEDDLKNHIMHHIEEHLRATEGELEIEIEEVANRAVHAIHERRLALALKTGEEAVEKIKQTVTAFAIRDWSKPPFGAACHAWAPGVHVPEALNTLKAFSLLGFAGANNVHVCGEAYSDYQGFIEGALRSAEDVVRTILG